MAVALSCAAAVADVRELPVPASTIYPNTIITGELVTGRRFKVTAASVAGFATAPSELIGKQTRRRLIAGKPIPLSSLSPPFAVRRGAVIAALYEEDGFSISTMLVALQDGAVGDIIPARNTASGAIVQAMVKPDGTLALDNR